MPIEMVFTEKRTAALLDYQIKNLGCDEIRGTTVATLVSQGTELAWFRGHDFPIRPGYAALFRVSEIGDNVRDVTIGEMRFCMGPHRQTQQVPVQFSLKIPENMDPSQALLARMMGVSMTTLMTTKARPGDKVMICGAGPVGLLAAHNFLIGGYHVGLVEPDSCRREQAQKSGVRDVFTHMPLDDPDYMGQVALVVDCSGHEQAVLDGCKIVRKMGEVVLVGTPWQQQTSLHAHEILHAVFLTLSLCAAVGNFGCLFCRVIMSGRKCCKGTIMQPIQFLAVLSVLCNGCRKDGSKRRI